MATTRNVLCCALTTGLLALGLATQTDHTAHAAGAAPDQARPASALGEARPSTGRSRLAGMASVPLAVTALLSEQPTSQTARVVSAPGGAGPRRCAPLDPQAFLPAPGLGRQRCGQPHALRRAAAEPARTRCGAAVLD